MFTRYVSLYFFRPLSFRLASAITLSASPIASVPTLQLLNKTPLSSIISSAFAHRCRHICSLLLPYGSPPFMPSVLPVLERFSVWRAALVENGWLVCEDATWGREW
jgi:hypothetical protein